MGVEIDVAAAMAQLGAAGLIGWMWLSERRGAMERERELRESHAVILGQRESLAALVELVRESSRVMGGLEVQQRKTEAAIDRLAAVVAEVNRGRGARGGDG